jgi:DNA-binding CsgD family transcriptional regulator
MRFLKCLFIAVLPIVANAQLRKFDGSLLNQGPYVQQNKALYAYLNEGRLDSAFLISAELLQFAAEKDQPVEQRIDAYLTVGRMLKGQKAHSLAANNFEKALRLYEAQHFAPSLYQQHLYASLAQLSEVNPKPQEQALYYYRKAYALAVWNRDTLRISSMLNNMGVVHLKANVLDSANYYFVRADSVWKHANLSFNELIMAINNNLAEVALRRHLYDDALKRYTFNQHLRTYQGYVLDTNIRIKRTTTALLGKIRVYLAQGNVEQARASLAKFPANLSGLSYVLYADLREKQLYARMLVLTQGDNWITFYRAQQNWSDFRDSVAGVRAQALSTFTEAMLERQLQHADETLASNTRLLEVRHSRIRIMWITAFLASVLIAVLIGFRLNVLRSRGKRLEMEQELYKKELENTELKKKALETTVKNQDVDLGALSAELMVMRNLNNMAQEKLREVRGKPGSEQVKQLQELSKAITTTVNQNKSRGLMHQHLEKVNTAFYARLEEVSPTKLSKGEKELAALLRLRLEDSEIAELRSTSVNAIHVTRHRLKKKLALDKQQDLEQFLRAL